MDLLGGLFISFAAVPEAEISEEEISSAINYIMSRRDYADRVRKSNLLGFTFLPPYNGRWQPRPMNRLDRFLNGDWRKCSWNEYAHKDKTYDLTLDKNPGSRKVIFKRRLTLAFLSAILADIALSFIIWLLIMMGFSFFGLDDKLGSQIDPLALLVGSSVILFILLFWGFFVFIKPKKFKL